MTQPRRSLAVVATAALLAAVMSACGSGTDRPSGTSTPAPTTSAAVPTPTPTPAPSATPAPGAAAITKLLVVVVENHSLDSMRAQMPYTFGLAEKYGYATSYRALTHPSLPNYLAIAGGDTFGITDDRSPAAHVLHGPSVFGQALARHLTAKAYAEDMETPCGPYDHGRYAVRHNPWAYFVDERSACEQYDVPMSELAADVRDGRLPNAGMVTPDLCADAHDCPLATADDWMHTVVGGIMAGPDFTSGRLLIVITADEDHKDQGNLVLTTVLNPQLHHVVVDRPLTHYSLSRLYSEVLGTAPLREARSAASMAKAFGLTLGPH